MKTVIFCLGLLAVICQGGEDIDVLYAQGIEELRAGHLVPAAKLLAQASEKYEAAGNDAAASDAASALFWCRKKFSIVECAALHSADEKAAAKAEAVVTRKVEPSNAEKALAKANSFAAGHQDDQLLVAIKYFEIASLYKGSDSGFKAMDLSLAAMGKIKNEPAKVIASAKPVRTGPLSRAELVKRFSTYLGEYVTEKDGPWVLTQDKDGEFHLLDKFSGNKSTSAVVVDGGIFFNWTYKCSMVFFEITPAGATSVVAWVFPTKVEFRAELPKLSPFYTLPAKKR